MALHWVSGEWWETESRIWVESTLLGQAGGKTEPFSPGKAWRSWKARGCFVLVSPARLVFRGHVAEGHWI